jgi:hypothetical protein
MNEIERLRQRLAATESRDKLRRLMREAEKIGADDLAARARDKITKLTGKPPFAGGSCPQLVMVVTPWTTDENGVMSREIYAADLPTTL